MKKAWVVFTVVVLVAILAGVVWALTNDDKTPLDSPDPKEHHVELDFGDAGGSYSMRSAIPEPSAPDWVKEREDGTFDCRYGGQSLTTRETELPNGDLVRWVVSENEPVTYVDFTEGTTYVAGIILGGHEFAAILPEMRPYGYLTLLISGKQFERYDQPVVVCSDLPEPE